MTDPGDAHGATLSSTLMKSSGLALSAELVAVRAAWVEAHKALFPGNAVLRQQVRPESTGLMCSSRKHVHSVESFLHQEALTQLQCCTVKQFYIIFGACSGSEPSTMRC